METSQTRTAFGGSRRKIVLAFDIGTTYSGISYSILDPGQVPGIKGVTKFPAQETISGASKIPTIIYYDNQGKVQAIGAEATKEGIYESAIDGDWYKAEWFKLHLRSKYGNGKSLNPHVPPLPPNKSIVDLFADFLRYLLKCAEAYIKSTHAGGIGLWDDAQNKGDINFVLSHPNGWEGPEQAQMRRAAVKAGLIRDTVNEHARVSFVTEGEASLHFTVENGGLAKAVEGDGIVIVDAGGGTIDVSTYYKSSSVDKRSFEEIAVPQCYFHGAVFVTFRAKDYLKDLLVDSKYGAEDDIQYISSCFDKTTKPRFSNPADPQYVKFGSTRDNDPGCDIRFGQLKIAGNEVAKFFQPSVDCVIQAVMQQRKDAYRKISHVVLVGGFSASDFVFEKVRTILTSRGLTVIRPDNHVNKAVSDGAVSFYLDHYVRSRVAKVTYGTECAVRYDPADRKHRLRSKDQIVHVDGKAYLSGTFSAILKKNTQVSEKKEFSMIRSCKRDNLSDFEAIEGKIMAYRGLGHSDDTMWLDENPGMADLSGIPKTQKQDNYGPIYYEAFVECVLLFGLTELEAQFRWNEDGVECRSPAKVIYGDDITT